MMFRTSRVLGWLALTDVALGIFLALAGNVSAVEFEISNSVVLGDEISVDVQLSGVTATNCPDGKCYLQGFLRPEEGSKYFGFTRNIVGDWIPYQSKPDAGYIIGNFLYCEAVDGVCAVEGARMKFNYDDVNYKGPGSYELKYGRYTGKTDSMAGDYSSSVIIQLDVASPTPTPSPTVEATLEPTTKPTATPTTKPTNSPKPTTKPTATPTSKSTYKPTTGEDRVEDEKSLAEKRAVLGSESEGGEKAEAEAGRKGFPWFAVLFVALGLGFMGVAGYPLYKPFLAKYNLRIRGKNEEQEVD